MNLKRDIYGSIGLLCSCSTKKSLLVEDLLLLLFEALVIEPLLFGEQLLFSELLLFEEPLLLGKSALIIVSALQNHDN
ncbi:hypothetical protein TKK_0001646 [Trichogramma kaykai]